MIKVVFLFKRIPGITHEQFREHYENVHVKLAQKYLGHLLISHERNYVENRDGEPAQWDYDCLTELVLRDQAALDEFHRIAAQPDLFKLFQEDELNFLQRKFTKVITFGEGSVVNTGTGGGHGTLERQANNGS